MKKKINNKKADLRAEQTERWDSKYIIVGTWTPWSLGLSWNISYCSHVRHMIVLTVNQRTKEWSMSHLLLLSHFCRTKREATNWHYQFYWYDQLHLAFTFYKFWSSDEGINITIHYIFVSQRVIFKPLATPYDYKHWTVYRELDGHLMEFPNSTFLV